MVQVQIGDPVQIARRPCSAPRGAVWTVVGHSRDDAPERVLIRSPGGMEVEVPAAFLAVARPEPEVVPNGMTFGGGRQLTFEFEAAGEVGA